VLCGDGICNSLIGENCVSCPLDCIESSCNVCGDSACNPRKDCYLCFEDCGPCNTLVCDLSCIHGTFYSNKCHCVSVEWTGPLCDTNSVQPITGVIYNDSNPSVAVNASSQFQYNIHVTSLVKLDSNGTIHFTSVILYLHTKGIERHSAINVSSLVFDFVQHNTSNIAATNYSSSLPNGAQLLISLLLFLQPTNITFTGTTTTYVSNTLKLAIHIKNWPFAALSNSLMIAIGVTQLSSSIFSQCGE
jgi:hypothetical protein